MTNAAAAGYVKGDEPYTNASWRERATLAAGVALGDGTRGFDAATHIAMRAVRGLGEKSLWLNEDLG